MKSTPILTLAVGETTGLNAKQLLAHVAGLNESLSLLQILFLGGGPPSGTADFLEDLDDKHVLWAKSDYDDGSIAAVLVDDTGGPTIVLVLAESTSVVNDVIELIPRLLISDIRYVVACRPYLAPLMIEQSSRLAFLHLPFVSEQALASSTSFALNRIQIEEDTPSAAARAVGSRAIRDGTALTLGERSKEQSGIEKALAEELLKSSSRLVKLQFLPAFSARGFSENKEYVEQRADCLVMSPREGHALWGPYVKLPRGDYRVGWLLSADQDGKSIINIDVAIDLTQVADDRVIVETNDPEWSWIEFTVDEQNENSPVEFRISDVSGDACRLHEITVRSQFE